MNWRDPILQYFTEPIQPLTLVADPDGLLLEEELLAAIQARSFDLLLFEDSVSFRYTYEANYRQHWDNQQQASLVVILRSSEASLQELPYDLLQSGRLLHFSLPELFPKLSYPVVKTLNPIYFQVLYDAHQTYQGPPMGDQSSKTFILNHVFGIAPELVKTPLDLLKLLFSRHLRAEQVPVILDEFLLAQLKPDLQLTGWPLAPLLSQAAEFFDFLQAQWLIFLGSQQRSESPGMIQEAGVNYLAQAPLPLGDPEVRVYLNTLFLEGRLKPVRLPEGWQIPERWTKIGIIQQPELEETRRFDQLLAQLRQNLPSTEALYKEWLFFAERWAELVMLRYRHEDHLAASARNSYNDLHLEVEARFADWLRARYHTLHNQPFYNRPVMGHHVASYLAAYRRRHGAKVRLALIIVDGLALDQWQIIREIWREQEPEWHLQTDSLFAWIPTLTTLARQSIFAGQPPQLFPDSWQTTEREAKRWQQFWQEHGAPATAVGYLRNLGVGVVDFSRVLSEGPGESSLEPETIALIENPRLHIAGLVVNTVDNISHGMQLGTRGMHQQIRLWLTGQGYLTRLVTKLLAENFTVFLTADHGNIWAKGIGRPKEGALVETRGQRARLYTDPAFLRLAQQQVPAAIEWPNAGLPQNLHVLLVPNLGAFLEPNDQAVCHGGITLEEVIVPFVQITRREGE